MKGHAIIGFNHGVLGLAENPALGPGIFRQNTSGYALGVTLGVALDVLTPKASPSGWVFSQAQHPMIKTYYSMQVAILPMPCQRCRIKPHGTPNLATMHFQIFP